LFKYIIFGIIKTQPPYLRDAYLYSFGFIQQFRVMLKVCPEIFRQVQADYFFRSLSPVAVTGGLPVLPCLTASSPFYATPFLRRLIWRSVSPNSSLASAMLSFPSRLAWITFNFFDAFFPVRFFYPCYTFYSNIRWVTFSLNVYKGDIFIGR